MSKLASLTKFSIIKYQSTFDMKDCNRKVLAKQIAEHIHFYDLKINPSFRIP